MAIWTAAVTVTAEDLLLVTLQEAMVALSPSESLETYIVPIIAGL